MKRIIIVVGMLLFVFILSTLTSAYFCHQEFANESTDCGGLDTGSYSVTSPPNYNWNDGNWSTCTYDKSENYRINYTKPLGAKSSSRWEEKRKYHVCGSTSTFNLRFDELSPLGVNMSKCWEQNPIQMGFFVYLSGQIFSYKVNMTCWNGTMWRKVALDAYVEAIDFCEEKMIWEMENITVDSVSVIYSQDLRRIFEIIVKPDGEYAINDINWSFNTGESTIYADKLFNLSKNDNLSILIDYNYSSYGVKNYNLTVFAQYSNNSKTGNIVIGSVGVSNFSVIYQDDTLIIFEFIIANLISSNSSINWTLDTGESNITHNYTINLAPYENVTVFAEYNYTSRDEFVAEVTLTDSFTNISANTNVSIPRLEIINFFKRYSNETLGVFEFLVENLFSEDKTLSWSFDTNDTAGIIWSANTSTLASNKNISILLEHNFSNIGGYLITARANISKDSFSESLNVSI